MTSVSPETSIAGVLDGCPICADTDRLSDGIEVQTTRRYRVAHCGHCGLAFTRPRPTGEELREFYTSTYFKRASKANLGYENYRGLAELNAHRMWGQINRYFDLDAVPAKRLLDVGCATGGFLSEVKAAGWECRGIELSREAVEVAREELALDVLQGDLSSVQFGPGSFGVITMWHVLEHMIDPADALRRAAALLVTGGYLFIELPNWNSMGRVLKGGNWSQLKPPEHINFFTRRSLRYAVGQCGLNVVRCDTHYPSMRDKAAVRRPSRPIYQLAYISAAIASRAGRGGYLRLLARKP